MILHKHRHQRPLQHLQFSIYTSASALQHLHLRIYSYTSVSTRTLWHLLEHLFAMPPKKITTAPTGRVTTRSGAKQPTAVKKPTVARKPTVAKKPTAAKKPTTKKADPKSKPTSSGKRKTPSPGSDEDVFATAIEEPASKQPRIRDRPAPAPAPALTTSALTVTSVVPVPPAAPTAAAPTPIDPTALTAQIVRSVDGTMRPYLAILEPLMDFHVACAKLDGRQSEEVLTHQMEVRSLVEALKRKGREAKTKQKTKENTEGKIVGILRTRQMSMDPDDTFANGFSDDEEPFHGGYGCKGDMEPPEGGF
ncbi:hypothetical protein C7974DRAFT_450581 [Boeremia exigua]|uniref:uncharacterized protein n=1 Tax=Boeremia exigua TaxID=749465 RepID=UPI001E8E735F|nr:uncharacterized protein C7974DRAFT_450581 [Boeremia exigua]KAH6637604.1 hypothetical protein C7974DRAFT_450581 [Boeremia exigua]